MNDDGRPANQPPTTGAIRVYGWHWGPEQEQRPGVPWLGLFLVVFGALLLIQRLVPGGEIVGAAFFLAVGIAFLLRWVADRRRVGSLYGGAVITALATPGMFHGLGLGSPPGLGTFAIGVAFLFIAVVRYLSAAGIGWQAWLGAILAVIGGSQLAEPGLGPLIVPLLILVLGALLVARGWRR